MGAAERALALDPMAVVMAVVMVLSGMLVKTAISVVSNTAVFWLIGSSMSLAFSLHQVGDLARYPITVYSLGIRTILTVVLPFAFVSFFPAAAILRPDTYAWAAVVTPLVALYCVAVAGWVFRRGLRRYESAGA